MIEVYKDDTESIVIVPAHNGVVVHLVTQIKVVVPDHQSILVDHLAPKTLFNREVKIRLGEVLNPNFKQEVQAAVSLCQKKVAELKQDRMHIEGALRDYVK